MVVKVSLLSGAVTSDGALSIQTNAGTEAIGITTGQVISLAQNPILSAGTINGVAYLNGSKVLTTGSALVFDGSNLGLGVTPSAWSAGGKIIELGFKGNIFYGVSYTAFGFANNAYYDATAPSGWKFANPTSSRAGYYEQSQGTHSWAISTASGTAGNAVSFTQAMTLDASGNLSVGMANGAGKMNIGAGGSFRFYRPDNATYGEIYRSATTGFTFNDANSDVFTWLHGGTERMRIDSSGNLLVGTSTLSGNARLSQKLVVVNTGSVYGGMSLTGYAGTAGGTRPILDINRSRGTTDGSFTAVVSGDLLGSLLFRGADGAAFQDAAMVSGEVDGAVASGSVAGRLTFSTAPAGGGVTERARIDSSGNFVMNNSGGNNPRIYCIGMYNVTGAASANVVIDSSGGMYRSTSSLKYKQNVKDAIHGLVDVMNLRSVVYESKNENEAGVVYGGLIAEEVHDAGLTEFVQYADDGTPDALAYGNMVSLCIKAIQEQQAIIQQLQADVSALKGA